MKPRTIEWVAKAEGDFRTAMREISAFEFPNYDAVCYHCQQCAEKYLKGMLVEAEVPMVARLFAQSVITLEQSRTTCERDLAASELLPT